MRKFYNEPEMAVKRFEAENIVTTASETQTNAVDSLGAEYATATGTLSRGDAGVILKFE